MKAKQNNVKKILIVDDDEDIINLIRIILENENYTIIGALSGQDGIKMALKEKPDLILLDIMMPSIDGWEVMKLLHADEQTRKIPVAMLTCKTDVRDKLTGLQEGAIDYITKPFSPDELVKRINKIFKILS